MVMVNITINGHPITTPSENTVLGAAQRAGIEVPTLCHHPALAPIGACRVCLVEVKGQRTLQPACTFPVTEGMEVQTESPAVVQARRFVLDLLFAERNHFCMYCPMSGDCELQDLGYRYGLDHWVYPTYTRAFPVDATRQAFMMDHNRCVLCRRCVRACGELVANHTLGMRQRGAKTMISADMNVPFAESSCVSCGACLQVCPTGALVDKRSAFMARNDQTERTRSTCDRCSVGCGMYIVTRNGNVLRVEGNWDESPNRGLLCQKGRFDPLYDARTRLTQPLVRRDGVLEVTDWDGAIEAAARGLLAAGAGRQGVLASSRLTNEAFYLLARLTSEADADVNVGLMNEAVPALLHPAGKLADLEGADVILVVGADPVEGQPVVSFLIKRSVDQGAHLVVVDYGENGLAPFAHRMLETGEIAHAVELAARARHPIVLYGPNLTVEAAWQLQRLDQARFVAIELGANTRAASGLGLNGTFRADAAEALLVIPGEEAVSDEGVLSMPAGAFLVVQASYTSPLTDRADVVLPMAIWSERSGSLTNLEGRTLPANKAVEPVGEAWADWKILAALARKMGLDVPESLVELSGLAACTCACGEVEPDAATG